MKKQFLKTAFITLIVSVLWGEVNAQVGFGTTSPSNDLDVESNSATATAIDINCTGAGDPKINFQLSGTSTFSMGIDNSDADKFKIGTSALETNTRLTIDASGNCGIGTTSPHAPLQFDNAALNRKIVLYESSDNDHQFLGFGVNNTILRYQLPAITNNHVFYTGTSSTTSNELMRITGTGNVGIGTSSPTARLDVDGSAIFNESGAATNFRVESDNNVGMLFVDGTNDRVGIGTSSPSVGFDVANVKVNIWSGSRFYGNQSSMPLGSLTIGNTSASFGGKSSDATNMCGFLMECKDSTEIAFHDMSSKVSSFVLYDGTNNRLTFGRDMGFGAISTLSLNGNVGIGTSAPSQKLHVVGNICATGTIATCSDLRYKKDVFKIGNALSLISKFNGYTYNFKVKEFPDHKFDSTAQVGFIAQELQEVLPQVVQKNESGYLSVDYAKVTPLLLMAIKEQQAEIETLKAQANAQKAEANTLKAETTQKLTDLESKMNAMLLLLNGNQEVTAKQ